MRPPAGRIFFTVVMFRRWPWFNDVRYVAHLRQAFAEEKARRPFQINAIVVMPDHLHTMWTLPEDDSDYSTRWRNIKRGFTTKVPAEERPAVWGSRADKQEQAIGQRRFWEHRIRNEADFANLVQTIHDYPVKHGYVERPEDWPYSSIHHPAPPPRVGWVTHVTQHPPTQPRTEPNPTHAPMKKPLHPRRDEAVFVLTVYRAMLGCTQPDLRS